MRILAKGRSTAKKYYWLKLKEDFFEEDTIEWLEEQENGVYYSNFYLKLCLKSLKTNGILIRSVGEIFIPYDVKKLSEMTRVKIDTVIVAMELFKKIGLVQILDNGEIYLTQLELMVGSETSKAQIMRNKRAREKKKGLNGGNNVTSKLPHVTHELPECYTEKDKEIDKDIELEKEIDKETDIEKDRDKEIKTEQRNTEKIQSCSSCDDYIDKSKKVIGKGNKRSLNHKDEIAIDIEENPNSTYEEYKVSNNDEDHIHNTSDKVNENVVYDSTCVIRHFEKCGFTVSEKLKKFIEEDIKKYGREMIIEAADECVRKGKSNNYGYLTGILQNWVIKGREENSECSARANTSAYNHMTSVFDEK